MKTRKKGTVVSSKDNEQADTNTSNRLDDNVAIPPQTFVLPKTLSPDARIISLPQDGATTKSRRYLVCPQQGFYEFTRIAAPKQSRRSWLLAPTRGEVTLDQQIPGPSSEKDQARGADVDSTTSKDSGYVLRNSDLFVATPIDPLFVILPTLIGSNGGIGQEYLAPSDYMVALTKAAPHLAQFIRPHSRGNLECILERRLEAVCDFMDFGDGNLYALSLPKLLKELIEKTKRTLVKGLPPSLEGRFVKQPLETPDSGIKREESSISLVTEDSAISTEGQVSSVHDSQNTQPSTNGSTITTTTKTSVTSSSTVDESTAPPEVTDLLRFRTVFDFIMKSYVPCCLHSKLVALLGDPKVSSVEFSALDEHLIQVESLRRRVHALRSLSDNVSRKRNALEDEEEVEKEDAKRRKKEDEENKKRSMSQGVKQLMKADTSGMKKLSAFFSKASAKTK